VGKTVLNPTAAPTVQQREQAGHRRSMQEAWYKRNQGMFNVLFVLFG